MFKKIFVLIAFGSLYPQSEIDNLKEEINKSYQNKCRDKKENLIEEYRNIMNKYQSHATGTFKFYHFSGCQWNPKGNPYTLQEAKQHTKECLQTLYNSIQQCSECFLLVPSLKELSSLVAEDINNL